MTPAISRWAQWGEVTNSLRNAAAVHAPPDLKRTSPSKQIHTDNTQMREVNENTTCIEHVDDLDLICMSWPKLILSNTTLNIYSCNKAIINCISEWIQSTIATLRLGHYSLLRLRTCCTCRCCWGLPAGCQSPVWCSAGTEASATLCRLSQRWPATQAQTQRTRTALVSWGADTLRHCDSRLKQTSCSCCHSQSELVKTPVAAEPRATSIAPWRQKQTFSIQLNNNTSLFSVQNMLCVLICLSILLAYDLGKKNIFFFGQLTCF